MSHSCWNTLLRQALANQIARNNSAALRVAVVGIGNEMNGDDAAGVEVARRLLVRLPAGCGWYVLDGGTAPENFTGPLRRFRPQVVLLVDAMQMDEPPGFIAWLHWQQAQGFSASTHTMPPTLLAKYLIAELDCQVGLVGIQAADLEEHGLTAQVEIAVDEVVLELTALAQTNC